MKGITGVLGIRMHVAECGGLPKEGGRPTMWAR